MSLTGPKPMGMPRPCRRFIQPGDTIMKSNDAKKEKKKSPLKTPKEKKLAKAEKKSKR